MPAHAVMTIAIAVEQAAVKGHATAVIHLLQQRHKPIGPTLALMHHTAVAVSHRRFRQKSCQPRRGVAFAVFFAGAPQGDALVQQAAVPDFGGFADHHSHAVVDEHAVADAGARMDFDAGETAAQLAEQPCGQLQRQP